MEQIIVDLMPQMVSATQNSILKGFSGLFIILTSLNLGGIVPYLLVSFIRELISHYNTNGFLNGWDYAQIGTFVFFLGVNYIQISGGLLTEYILVFKSTASLTSDYTSVELTAMKTKLWDMLSTNMFVTFGSLAYMSVYHFMNDKPLKYIYPPIIFVIYQTPMLLLKKYLTNIIV